ncbi:efflux RND transporter periplasmic adaptor subunit [Bacteroidota bacterium]
MRTITILLAFAALTSACGRGDKAVADTAHEDEVGRQLTMFTDSAEFYVEHPNLFVGQEAEFLVHLTGTGDYKPFTQGSVRITLDFGDNQSTAVAGEPITPGIWLISVTPGQPGSCDIIFEHSGISRDEKVVSVGGSVAEKDHKPDDHSAGEGPPEGIRFTKEQAWKSDFAVQLLNPLAFQGIIKAGGEILPMPGEKYYIHAMNAGIVNYLKDHLVAGADVISGEDLISVEGKGLVNENISVSYEEAKIRFQQSRSEYARHLKLFSENAISEKEFIASRSGYITDSIRFQNLKTSYEGGGLTVSSPVGGHIHDLLVSQGEYVEAGQLIATVSSDLRLLLRADVPQQYFNRIGDVVTANFRTSYQDKVWEIEDFKGELIAIGSSVMENNQYLPVYFEVQNNGELLEGAYAEFFLKTMLKENCITVPSEAILEEQGRHFVYVQVSGETFQKREIIPGESDGNSYRVERGLQPGERVVTRGSMLLKAASLSTALPGHSHDH